MPFIIIVDGDFSSAVKHVTNMIWIFGDVIIQLHSTRDMGVDHLLATP